MPGAAKRESSKALKDRIGLLAALAQRVALWAFNALRAFVRLSVMHSLPPLRRGPE
jgi:hypothetical protein